jgi:hypothetical protein
MRQDKRKGEVTERAKYCVTMAKLIEQRVEKCERSFDDSKEKDGWGTARVGYEIDAVDGQTNIKRMITQLRMELLELGRMI